MTHRRAFTLIELLVVIGIIGLLATITVVAVARITDEGRLTSGVSAVELALDAARTRAIRDNQPIGVFFVADWSPDDPDVRQRTTAVIARFTGEIETFTSGVSIVDRFVPVADLAPFVLPAGIKVAGPHYSNDGDGIFDPGDDDGPYGDLFWVTQPELQFTDGQSPRFSSEFPGQLVGVLFGGDGRVMTNNPATGSRELWLDTYPGEHPDDTGTSVGTAQDVFPDVWPGMDAVLSAVENSPGSDHWKWYDHHRDEPNVQLVPFLAVFDDDRARARKFNDWSVPQNYAAGVSDFVEEEGVRIHFNRYSGVVMR